MDYVRKHITRREALALGCFSLLSLASCKQDNDNGAQLLQSDNVEQQSQSDNVEQQSQSDNVAQQSQSDNVAQLPQRTFFAFDTVCVIGGDLTNEQLQTCTERCFYYEQLFSRTIASSDISSINNAHGEPVFVAPETSDLIEASLYYARLSQGLFDITIGAVSSLWDFQAGTIPDTRTLNEALKHVGYEHIHVEDGAVWLDDPLAQLDVGGIAKGWIADALVSYLLDEGVKSAYINLGGNVCVIGAKPNGSPWNIGIRNPFSDTQQSFARIACEGGSVVTSGIYERSFEKEGKRYWHILDPRTGYPAETQLASASIYSKCSLAGEGLTKPLFMMDPEEACAFIEKLGKEHASGQGEELGEGQNEGQGEYQGEERGEYQALLIMQDGSTRATKASNFELL